MDLIAIALAAILIAAVLVVCLTLHLRRSHAGSLPPQRNPGPPVVRASADGAPPTDAPPRVSILRIVAKADRTADLIIYGPIGDLYWDGISAREMVQQIGAIDADTINVRINSDGGVITEGTAIYNALKRHKARKVVTVDGIAASIASAIAMVGDEIVMPANSLLMIHAPWTWAAGNAKQLRETADTLDTHGEALATMYTRSGKSVADIQALFEDGKDHWYTGEKAVAEGFADRVEDAQAESEESAAAASLQAYINALTKAPAAIAARLRQHLNAAAQPRTFASVPLAIQRSVVDQIEDPAMKRELLQIMANAAGAPAAPAPTPAQPAVAANPPANPPAPTPAPAAPAAADVSAVLANLQARNTQIVGEFAPFRDVPGMADLQTQCLSDPALTVEQIRGRMLNALGNRGEPLNPTGGGGEPSVVAGRDQRDRSIDGMTNWILARVSTESNDATTRRSLPASADPQNPFRGYSLFDMAEHFARTRGVNTRGMQRMEIVAAAMRPVVTAQGHTRSDFAVLFDNAMHKLMIALYRGAPTTWQRFCRVGDLADFRPHYRYRFGTFSDLEEVTEAGNYKQGTVSDAERETITATRKGRILLVTREMIVDDDLQAIADTARGLMMVAARTIDKAVFALFALNSGNGPTMSDGNPLFHASHSNIAGTAAVPSMASFEAARVQMAQQQDVSGNDYIDVRPAIWLGPLSIGGTARSVNASEYDPDATSKLQKPNIVRGLYSDIVDTPRLSGTAWYSIASPAEEPVFEVGFVGGQRDPRITQEEDFDSSSLKWKVEQEAGVGAIGWRGINKNAGV